MGQQDFYRFLQIRHYLRETLKGVDMLNLEVGLMKLFRSAYNSEPTAEIISKIYKCFLDIYTGESQYIKEKWDRESNGVLTGEEWRTVCRIQWKTSSSLSWREFSWK